VAITRPYFWQSAITTATNLTIDLSAADAYGNTWTPATGDLVLIEWVGFDSRISTGCSGLSATSWDAVTPTVGDVTRWYQGTKSSGAMTAGVVTVTQNASGVGHLRAHVLRGYSATSALAFATSRSSTTAATETGPSALTVGNNQVAFVSARFLTTAATFPATATPASGWTYETAITGTNRYSQSVWQAPSSTETNHTITASGASGNNKSLYLLELGTYSAPPTDTTAVVSASLPALSAAAEVAVTQDGAVAATLPALSASADATVTYEATVAAALPSLTAEVLAVADDTTFGQVDASLPALSAAAVVDLPSVVEAAASLPSLTATVEVDVTPAYPAGSVDASLPSLSGSVVVDAGLSLEPWTDGLHGEALIYLDAPVGALEVTYPAEPAPAVIVETPLFWQSHESAVIGGDTSGMTSVELGVPHVWIDGVDVTYFRDVPVGFGPWREESPFAWTGTSLTFPQVFHYEERGTGDLAWMRPDAPVTIAIVKPDDSRIHKFTGFLTSEDPGVGRGRTECVWQVAGILHQADFARHPVPARLDTTDIGSLIAAELNGTPSRRFSYMRSLITGIKSRQRGSTNDTRWTYASGLLATAVREDGKQWTLEPTGTRSFALKLKDTTTVNWTVTAGAPGVECDLTRDDTERIDVVYGYGVGPDGYAWWNNFFPDLLPYDPPDYPFSDPDRNVLVGDTDADTLTGTGVSDWQQRIRDLGYKSIAVDGVMNTADLAAVRWIQRLRGIQVDGYLGPQTWAATWNIGTIGGDLTVVRRPLAWRTECEPYLYGANGAVVGNNPDYDPDIIVHEIDVDFGAGVTKADGRDMAQRILERGTDPGIAGTVRLQSCPWEGSRWEISAGDNILLKGWRGTDVLMRVVAVDADPASLTVTLTVDSEFRDAMTVVEVLKRNAESRPDPARRPGNPSRRSRLDQDMAVPFEGESPAGRFPKMAIFGGLWTVWPVPVSEIGVVAKLRFQTSGPTSKFAMAVFGRAVTANQIAAKVPNPLAVSNPWNDAGDAWLESVAFVDAWGEEGQAAGYGMLGSESDDDPVTGELYDDAGFPFVSAVPPWLWVAVYAPVATFIEGRIYPDPVQ
jgi:peptidoglycan hydrolase-like protein with peptidoglycan-binding domain